MGDEQGGGEKKRKTWADWANRDDNREKRNKARREKYKADAKVREQSIQRTREWQKAQRKPRVRQARPLRKPRTPRIVNVGGRELEVVTTGRIAAELGYSADTFNGWRKRGVLPPPTVEDADGHALYSWEYVAALRTALDAMAMEPWSLKLFKALAEKFWKKTAEAALVGAAK